MLRNTFEAYQHHNGVQSDHAALNVPQSAQIKFMVYSWKSMNPETLKCFNADPLQFMAPLLTLFRQALAADLQNLRAQYRTITGQTHATESREKMLLALWVQIRRDIETFSTTTRAVESYVPKNFTHTSDNSIRSAIRDAMNDHIRILAQAREDEAYIKDRLSVNVGTLSLTESRNSIIQSRSTGRVTFLAFIFLSLSFVTSFFGMNIQELTGNGSSVTAFCAAAIGTAFTILIWALINFTLRLMEAWKEYDREIVESQYELDYSTLTRLRETWKKVNPEKQYR
ncbi:hypothetical protein PISL3812_00673 [Talaromyces islandicus]|uniref:Uncharacterized protein n=1 Tax=Talaromyces islandicus TaxID=28573 RepID=A0A0U1LKM2_TALIS|nr:hypothetical protein PISL3812_00673 [Talaromyces islandicus]